MKRQQVISRFFAPKQTSSSSASTQKDFASSKENPIVSVPPNPPPSVKKGPSSVGWPSSRGRRTLNSESLPSSFSRKRAIDTISSSGGILSSEEVAQGEETFESRLKKKRSSSDHRASSSRVDGSDETLVPHEFGADADVDAESPGAESDPEVLSTEHDQLCDFDRSDHPGASSDVDLRSQQGNNVSERCSEAPGGTSDGVLDVKQSEKRPSQDFRAEIPAPNPVKHKLFVEKLLARIDKNGEVKKPWYGSPPTGKEKLTPLEVQVVELKAKYPDVMLMVEVGYRYRFFGDDAETAGRILGIFPHYDHSFLTASIPTFRLHFHVRRLVAAGLKVGVVRQTETAAIKAHGSNKTGPFARGLSALYTRSTIEAAEDLGGGSAEGQTSRPSSYLMCIAERPLQTGKGTVSKSTKLVGNGMNESEKDVGSRSGSYDTEFGVVAVETATGDVMFGNFKDTVVRTELESHLITCSPAELLLAGPFSAPTDKLLKDFAGPSSEIRVERVSRDCFKDGGALAEVVDFYTTKDDCESAEILEAEGRIAENGLEVIMSMPDIVVQALALALRYLQQFNLERVLRLGAVFRPFSGHEEMNLSPNSLRQLEILNNNTDWSKKGSLLWLMDHTETAFGGRLLRYWVTHPLCDHTLIAARLDAVAEIAKSTSSLGHSQIEGTFPGSGRGGGARSSLQQSSIGGLLRTLGRMPDLERGLTRIFHRTATTSEFVNVIQALVTSAKHLQRVRFDAEDMDSIVEEGPQEENKKIKSTLLQRLVSAIASPSLCEHANRLLSALNTDAATAGDKLNLFNCTDGRFPEVAKCRLAIKAAEKELDEYLPGFRKLLRTPNLQYLSINGVSHLVEAPAAQRVPANWMKVNSTKKTTRYHPPDVIESRDKLALAQEELAVACVKAWNMFLAEFSTHYVDFRASVQALAALDCLHSLAVLSRNQGYVRPEFVGDSKPSQFKIQSGRHPILDSTLQNAFVPNDTFLGGPNERCQIITGPNMGGKSCYIRQVALIAIMAQVGSFVPAASAKLHVFDSVQTRMGASDSLHKGSSTFFEELSETSTILRTATSRSLVILDELGRGTSTHDGVAIAYATLHHLLKETKCLTLFVTHYPKIAELMDEFPGEVNSYYVSYMAHESGPSKELAVESSEDGNDTSEDSQTITFLYKLVPGVASRSFGLHVARLAQIPEACVLRAANMAAKFEKEVSNRKRLEVTSGCVEEGRTPKQMTMLDHCRATTDNGVEEDTKEGISLCSREASSNSCHLNRNVTSDKDALPKSVDDCEESGNVQTDGMNIVPDNNQIVLSSVKSSAEASNSSLACCSTDVGEGGSLPDGGHVFRTGNRKFMAESELRGLFCSIQEALEHHKNPEECMSMLVDVQKQARAAIPI
ncbi:unnamed protein product [Calypogeia fissa]